MTSSGLVWFGMLPRFLSVTHLVEHSELARVMSPYYDVLYLRYPQRMNEV